MAIAVQTIHPVAHVPLVLGVLRRLEVATVIDRLIPSHPAVIFHISYSYRDGQTNVAHRDFPPSREGGSLWEALPRCVTVRQSVCRQSFSSGL